MNKPPTSKTMKINNNRNYNLNKKTKISKTMKTNKVKISKIALIKTVINYLKMIS